MRTKSVMATSLFVIVAAVACGGVEVPTAKTPDEVVIGDSASRSSFTEAQSYLEAGVGYHEQGLLNEAIAEYDEAIRLDSQDALACCPGCCRPLHTQGRGGLHRRSPGWPFRVALN